MKESKIDFKKMNQKVIPDPLTGGNQTIYFNDEGTFYMSIPDRAIPLPKGVKLPQFKTTENKDGSKTVEFVE